MGRRVVEALGKGDQLLVAHLLNEVVHGHGVDQLAVADGRAVLEGDGFLGGIDLGDLALLAVPLLLLREGVGHGNPDATGPVPRGKSEGGVGAPVAGDLIENDVLGDQLDIRSRNTLTEPLALHLNFACQHAPHQQRLGHVSVPCWSAPPTPCSYTAA